MALFYFNAKFTVTNSIPISGTEFNVTADIVDSTGLSNGGLDVQVGDIVILDTLFAPSYPGTISRYRVSQINAQTPLNVDVNLTWNDFTGSPIDPIESMPSEGYIARAAPVKKFAWHSAPNLQGINDYIVQYARDAENFGNFGWTFVTANYTAFSGDQIGADTSAGLFTITLPASPNVSDSVRVIDAGGTFLENYLTIDPNGNNIGGIAQNFIMDFNNMDVTFVYYNPTRGWLPVK